MLNSEKWQENTPPATAVPRVPTEPSTAIDPAVPKKLFITPQKKKQEKFIFNIIKLDQNQKALYIQIAARKKTDLQLFYRQPQPCQPSHAYLNFDFMYFFSKFSNFFVIAEFHCALFKRTQFENLKPQSKKINKSIISEQKSTFDNCVGSSYGTTKCSQKFIIEKKYMPFYTLILVEN